MATFNTSTKRAQRTTNRSGHDAYVYPDKKTQLVTYVATCLVGEPKLYGDTTSELEACAKAVATTDPAFIARLAIYTRRVFMLRSVAQELVCILAESPSARGTGLIRAAARGIIRRGDDVTGTIACWMTRHPNTTLPDGLRKGLRDAMEAFGPEDITRYLSEHHTVTMRDALRIVRPSTTDEALAQAFHECVKRTARRPKTWETELSARGNTAEVWADLFAHHRIAAMACVRNLRNMLEARANLRPAIDLLNDPEAIKRSGMLPFRLYAAWTAITSTLPTSYYSFYDRDRNQRAIPTALTRAINRALIASTDNLPDLPGTTIVIVDGSGSMYSALSKNSSVTILETAATLAASIAVHCENICLIVFDDNARIVPLTSPDSPLSSIHEIVDACSGGVTNMSSAVQLAAHSGIDADRVIIISDNEVNSGFSDPLTMLANNYRQTVGHDVWFHGWDIAGYGTTQIAGPKTSYLCGFSDQVVDLIALAEQGFDSITKRIEHIKLPERGSRIKAEITYNE